MAEASLLLLVESWLLSGHFLSPQAAPGPPFGLPRPLLSLSLSSRPAPPAWIRGARRFGPKIARSALSLPPGDASPGRGGSGSRLRQPGAPDFG